jgi:hypothetical protein
MLKYVIYREICHVRICVFLCKQIAEKEKLGFERPVLRQKQKGDGVSPIREMTEGDRSISRMRQTSSPPAPRKLSQVC